MAKWIRCDRCHKKEEADRPETLAISYDSSGIEVRITKWWINGSTLNSEKAGVDLCLSCRLKLQAYVEKWLNE